MHPLENQFRQYRRTKDIRDLVIAGQMTLAIEQEQRFCGFMNPWICFNVEPAIRELQRCSMQEDAGSILAEEIGMTINFVTHILMKLNILGEEEDMNYKPDTLADKTQLKSLNLSQQPQQQTQEEEEWKE